MILRCIIRCPHCGFKTIERMPRERSVYVYRCNACGESTKLPATGRCVFCTYGSVSCPPAQALAQCKP